MLGMICLDRESHALANGAAETFPHLEYYNTVLCTVELVPSSSRYAAGFPTDVSQSCMELVSKQTDWQLPNRKPAAGQWASAAAPCNAGRVRVKAGHSRGERGVRRGQLLHCYSRTRGFSANRLGNGDTYNDGGRDLGKEPAKDPSKQGRRKVLSVHRLEGVSA